ncbi:MAG: pyridoxal phosphate-dependent aminotransferase [Acidobacteria bacterium]|nr:pyridoxal phosphate-dependent aminotransferase [Acidobacteriota bacterium]
MPHTRNLRLSQLAPGSVQSEIRSMSLACDLAGGINLAQGICDTEVPAPVLAEAKAAMEDGRNIYTRLDGIQRLRNAIAADASRRHGVPVDANTQVLVTSGATGAFHATCMALLDPGDEVIVFEPFYGYHLGTLKSLRMQPVIVALEDGAGLATWELNVDALRKAVTPRTRAILINTPSNPAGKVFTRAELEAIGAVGEEHDLFLITDEIYEHFIYEGAEHISPISLPGLRERTIVMSGFSKTYSITGWRVGYLLADAKWIPSIGYFHDMTFICAPAPAQHGAAAGLEQLPPSFYTSLAADHLIKRDMLLAALRDAGLTPHTPQGAYYILAKTHGLNGANAAQKARDLLARTGVAAVAGSAFFRAGKGEDLLRFCYGKTYSALKEACDRIRSLR